VFVGAARDDAVGWLLLDDSRLLVRMGEGLELFDIRRGGRRRMNDHPLSKWKAAAVIPGGRYVIYGDGAGGIHTWDLKEDRRHATLRDQGPVIRSMYVTADGHWLATTDAEHVLAVWDLRTSTWKLNHAVDKHTSALLTPEGDRAVVPDNDLFGVKVWNLRTGELDCATRGHSARVSTLVVTSDGKRAVSGSDDGTVRVWNLPTPGLAPAARQNTGLSGHVSKVTALATMPDGARILSGSVDGVKVWDVRSGQVKQTFDEEAGWVDEILVSPDGGQLTILFSKGFNHSTIVFGDQSDQHNIPATFSHQWSGVRTITVCDGGTLQKAYEVVGDWGDRAEYEESLTGPSYMTPQPFWEMRIQPRRMIAAREGGKVILTHATGEGTFLYVMELSRSGYKKPEEVRNPDVYRLWAVAPDGMLFVLESDDRVLTVFDSATGNSIRSLTGYKEDIREVAFTPNGRVLLSLSADEALHAWAVGTEQLVSMKFGEQVAIKAIAEDSRHLVLSTGKQLQVVGLSTDTGGSLLEGHRSEVSVVTVSPDGRRVLSASVDRAIKVWDLGDGKQLASAVLDHPVQKAVFTLDGSAVVVGDAVGKVRCLVLRGLSAGVRS
jgi:WD40 repeat protein